MPRVNNSLLRIPRNQNYGEYSPAVSETIYGGFNWSHQFNDNWSVKNRISVNQMRNDMNHYDFLYFSDNTNVSRLIMLDKRQINTYATNVDVTGHFDTGKLKHTLLLDGAVSDTPSSADAVNPRVGILWQPQHWLSVYANYLESFGANYGNIYISPTTSSPNFSIPGYTTVGERNITKVLSGRKDIIK